MKHDGLKGILAARRAPGVGRSRFPGPKYYHGLARFPGDRQAFCSTEREWDEKRARRGMTVRPEDAAAAAESGSDLD